MHRACAIAERSMERRAEPLSALFLDADEYPRALADVAWHNLVCNSAHDSSCACSVDEVVDQSHEVDAIHRWDGVVLDGHR